MERYAAYWKGQLVPDLWVDVEADGAVVARSEHLQAIRPDAFLPTLASLRAVMPEWYWDLAPQPPDGGVEPVASHRRSEDDAGG